MRSCAGECWGEGRELPWRVGEARSLVKRVGEGVREMVGGLPGLGVLGPREVLGEEGGRGEWVGPAVVGVGAGAVGVGLWMGGFVMGEGGRREVRRGLGEMGEVGEMLGVGVGG